MQKIQRSTAFQLLQYQTWVLKEIANQSLFCCCKIDNKKINYLFFNKVMKRKKSNFVCC